jgi:glyoxylase I family protein
MPVLAIDHYNLHANPSLMEVLREFYCSVVGLEVGPRPAFAEPGYWLYAGQRPIVHLTQAGPDEERATHVATTIDHVAFACNDLPELEARLTAAGVPFRRSDVPARHVVQLFLRDPAGNGVELNFA